jgi:hypothetical protein
MARRPAMNPSAGGAPHLVMNASSIFAVVRPRRLLLAAAVAAMVITALARLGWASMAALQGGEVAGPALAQHHDLPVHQ